MITVEQANGGYILEWHGKRVFSNFNDLVQWMARHFGETQIGVEWKP